MQPAGRRSLALRNKRGVNSPPFLLPPFLLVICWVRLKISMPPTSHTNEFPPPLLSVWYRSSSFMGFQNAIPPPVSRALNYDIANVRIITKSSRIPPFKPRETLSISVLLQKDARNAEWHFTHNPVHPLEYGVWQEDANCFTFLS